MLNPDAAERIRAIFNHDGSSVTMVDFIILLGWSITTFEDAVKWRVVTVEDSAAAVPRIAYAQLLEQAREQWSQDEIAEALGADATRVATAGGRRACTPRALPASAHAAPPTGSAGTFIRDSGSASGVGTSVPVATAPLRPHVPYLPGSPSKRRRRLAALRRATPQPVSLPPTRRNRPDGVHEATMITACAGDNDSAPHLRLRGHWLARFGFKPASRIFVTPSPGQLVITLRDPAAVTAMADRPTVPAPRRVSRS